LTKDCPTAAIATQDVVSDNKTSLLVSAVVGSVLSAALLLFLAAYFMRGEAMVGFFSGGIQDIPASGWENSGVFQQATTGGESGAYVGN